MIVYGKTELGCFNLCWDLGISWHRVSAARAFQYFGFSNTERKIPKIWFKETTFGYRVFAKWPNAFWKPKWYFVKTECCCRLLPLQLNPNILTGWYHGFSSELLFVSVSVVVFAFVQMCICICHLEAKVVHRKDGMLLQPNMIWVMTFDDISSELLPPTPHPPPPGWNLFFEWVRSTIGRFSCAGREAFVSFWNSFKTVELEQEEEEEEEVELERRRRRRGEIWFRAEPPSCSSIRQ